MNECAVIGIPDEILGQSIKAFIVRSGQNTINEEIVRNYCMENLESFAVPGQIQFVENLSRTAHGEIDKKTT